MYHENPWTVTDPATSGTPFSPEASKAMDADVANAIEMDWDFHLEDFEDPTPKGTVLRVARRLEEKGFSVVWIGLNGDVTTEKIGRRGLALRYFRRWIVEFEGGEEYDGEPIGYVTIDESWKTIRRHRSAPWRTIEHGAGNFGLGCYETLSPSELKRALGWRA